MGLSHYCHFTSPIRRYVDLVVHRILFGESDDLKALEEISSNSSEQERISAKAENHVVLLKKLRLVHTIHEKEPLKQYEAIVTRIKNFGVFFEVLDYMLEGFLHVSQLEDDYFVYDEANVRLRGIYNGRSYCSGDKITVMLKSVDFILLESEWNLVASAESPRIAGRGPILAKKGSQFGRKGSSQKRGKQERFKEREKPERREQKFEASAKKKSKPALALVTNPVKKGIKAKHAPAPKSSKANAKHPSVAAKKKAGSRPSPTKAMLIPRQVKPLPSKGKLNKPGSAKRKKKT